MSKKPKSEPMIIAAPVKREFGEGITVDDYRKLRSDKGGNARGNKFNAQKTSYNGVMYDSKLEASYAFRLDTSRKAAGKDRVVNIERQKKYSFDLNGKHICSYVLDFMVTFADGRVEYHEVKGFETRESSIKRKLMKAFYNIDLKVIKQ
jgi:hypothetical protein